MIIYRKPFFRAGNNVFREQIITGKRSFKSGKNNHLSKAFTGNNEWKNDHLRGNNDR